MKKISKLIVSICLLISCAFVLTACGHKHTYAEEWSTNETHHWQEATCEHSEEKSNYGEHVYTDNNDTTCNTCSYERNITSSPTNAELSAAYKNAAVGVWESIGVSDPTVANQGYSATVPDKKNETTDSGELSNIKGNANSMAGVLYMISLLYQNDNFVLTNGIVIFDASCSMAGQTYSYTFTLKPTANLENNTITLEFYNVIDGVPMQQYSNVEIDFNFETNQLNSYRFYTAVGGMSYVDMALTQDGKNMFYSTTDTTDTFAVAVEAKKTALLTDAESVQKLTTRFDTEMQAYFDVLNEVLAELN